MKVQVVCPGCGKRSNVDPDRVGKKLRCKACETVFQVSDPSANSSIDDTSWLDDGAEGEPAARPSNSVLPRSRSASGGGSSANLTIAIGAGAVALVALVIGLAVLINGRGPTPPAGGAGAPPAAPSGPGLFQQVVNAVSDATGAGDDMAGFVDPGPLPPPLLPQPPLRNLAAHERRVRAAIAGVDELVGILASIHDAESLKATVEKFESLRVRMAGENARNPEPFPMTPAEDSELTKKISGDMRRAMTRIHEEADRITGLPWIGVAGVRLKSLAFDICMPVEQALRRAESYRPPPPPAPYAEIFVKLQKPDDANVFRHKLEGLLDGTGGIQAMYHFLVEGASASFRAWPVSDVQDYARQIPYGDVKAKGRRIFVNGGPIPDDVVAAAKEAEKKRVDDLNAAIAAARPPDPEANDPKPPPDADNLTKTLFALRSSRSNKRNDAVAQLSRIPMQEDRRDEVHKALAVLLEDRDGFLVNAVMKAMVHWRTDETVPALIKILDRPDFGVRWEAEALLGSLGDARAAEALAARLGEDGIRAEPALRALGAAAEPALIGLLRDSDPRVRAEACRILKDVGGKQTLETMMNLPADLDFSVQVAARDAMQAIRGRVGPIEVPKNGGTTKGKGGKAG